MFLVIFAQRFLVPADGGLDQICQTFFGYRPVLCLHSFFETRCICEMHWLSVCSRAVCRFTVPSLTTVHQKQRHHCLTVGFMCVCQLVSVKQTSVTKKKDSMRAMALDSDNNQIQVKDVVKVVDGPHSVSSSLPFFPARDSRLSAYCRLQ